MTTNYCEICGEPAHTIWHNERFELQTVDVTSTDDEGTSWDEITACGECLDIHGAYKIVNVTENGVTSSGWIIDDPKLYFKFWRV